MTDYASIAENLSSHGYVVISVQHDLQVDEEGSSFWSARSFSRNAKVIDNILYVFEWLKLQQKALFNEKINLNRVGFIGHSFGANSLLFFVNRSLNAFQECSGSPLLFREDQTDVKECLVLMEATKFSFPSSGACPLFFLQAEERESYQKETGFYEQMIKAGHKVRYYEGSTHISFMDHGYITPLDDVNVKNSYFNGGLAERMVFFDQLREDILTFLNTGLK